MTTQAAFTPQEWTLLRTVPALVASGVAAADPGGKGAMDSEEPSAPDPVAKADDPAVTAARQARLAEAKRLDRQGLELECMDLVRQIRD